MINHVSSVTVQTRPERQRSWWWAQTMAQLNQNWQGGLQGIVSRSYSWGNFRGKHSKEKGWRSWGGLHQNQESFSPASTSMGMNPKDPRTMHMAGTPTLSVPGHIMPSMWQADGVNDKIATSVIKVFCYPNSFCLHAVTCSSTTTTPERTQNISAYKVHGPKGRSNW